jgi:hypothetical protein
LIEGAGSRIDLLPSPWQRFGGAGCNIEALAQFGHVQSLIYIVDHEHTSTRNDNSCTGILLIVTYDKGKREGSMT